MQTVTLDELPKLFLNLRKIKRKCRSIQPNHDVFRHSKCGDQHEFLMHHRYAMRQALTR